jgi:branched-chain amino acid transport system permease protein
MDTFLAALFSGTSRGAIYALVALGLVIVWRGAGVVNFAQMGQAMFSTYIASTLIQNGNSYWVGFFVALFAGAALGALLDILVMRPLSNKKKTELLSSESMRAAIPVYCLPWNPGGSTGARWNYLGSGRARLSSTCSARRIYGCR